MKKNTLYTVNKWNSPALGGKLYAKGGLLAEAQAYKSQNPWDFADDKSLIGQYIQTDAYKQGRGGLFNMTRESNPFSRGNIGGTIGALGPIVGTAGSKLISDGYNAGGIGNGISSIGSSVGSAISTVNPLVGGIVSAASGIVGGLVNRGFGTKKNEKNIGIIEQNTSDLRSAGNALASTGTSTDFFDAAGRMSSSSGFGTTDLVKGGWFSKKKARKQGQKYIDAENNALAFQDNAMMTGASTVDSNLDSSVMSNFAALGGPIETLTNNDDMSAINYGFMSDYLTQKKLQNEAKNKTAGISPMPALNAFAEGGGIEIKHPGRLTRLKERTGKTEAELWAEGNPDVRKMITFARNSRKWSKAMGGKLHKDRVEVPDNVFCSGGKLFHGGGCLNPNLFDIGGDIQMNGGDYTTGLTHISAGKSHEENPYEGVQVGVDREGNPNLVEEGETIYNDYVYSNRILADEATKQKFRLPKKRDITFADISKKLEKEASERPNDPISQAAFRVQMQDLADQQERQKQEMEAQRAREAFEALSPEEQTALMQQAAQQEQMAQQQAMQEQAAMEQQQPSPEEMAMAEQQQMMQADGSEAVVSQEPQMNAYGGKVNKFAGTQPGSNQMRNAGTWKAGNTSSNWNTYTRGGLRDYLENVVKRIQMAPDDETANTIRQEAINTVANIQQAYAKAYQNELTPVSEREDVGTLQSAFQNAGGNKYFGSIADNINLPFGHNTTDTEAGGWVDKLWGPRTSIRNWGSTEYGDADYYKDIADLATQAGLVYSPNTDWTYGDNYQLYGLSLLNPTATSETPASDTGIPDRWKWENIDSNTAADGKPNTPNEANKSKRTGTADNEWEVTPNYRNDKLRYAGLFGPAVGLGMQALGIGRPNTKGLEGVLDAYDKQGAATADYRPIGNYLRYNPMDIWYEQNRMDANARTTDRALQNNASPIGNRMAGLLASGYNSQTADGQLYRQALEYNDALRKQTADFNRGTDMFNAESYNRAALQNAEVRNRDRQLRANLGMQAAQAKMDADAGWYNGIYGNVAGLFKGIGDLGRENAQHNMIAEMAADGIFGPISPRTNTGRRDGYLTFTKKSAAKGGKINRKKGGK